METLFITKEDAGSLGKILNLFNDFRTQSTHKGSLTIDNITLAWDKDDISLTFKHPPAKHLLEEG